MTLNMAGDATGRATAHETINHDARDRHDSWDYKSESYEERNVNSDGNASWCYVPRILSLLTRRGNGSSAT